ncbi:hypothetical protein, partial [Salmonella enterica]|uniref:hypothetical protein n=1 Tax=Salmonella enterica TaxID=28901 RepID=UPI0020C2E4CC
QVYHTELTDKQIGKLDPLNANTGTVDYSFKVRKYKHGVRFDRSCIVNHLKRVFTCLSKTIPSVPFYSRVALVVFYHFATSSNK